jgi:hypothetical protein
MFRHLLFLLFLAFSCLSFSKFRLLGRTAIKIIFHRCVEDYAAWLVVVGRISKHNDHTPFLRMPLETRNRIYLLSRILCSSAANVLIVRFRSLGVCIEVRNGLFQTIAVPYIVKHEGWGIIANCYFKKLEFVFGTFQFLRELC